MAWAAEKPVLSRLRRPEVHHQARGVGSFRQLLRRTHPRRLAALADAGDPGLVDASLPHLPPPRCLCPSLPLPADTWRTAFRAHPTPAGPHLCYICRGHVPQQAHILSTWALGLPRIFWGDIVGPPVPSQTVYTPDSITSQLPSQGINTQLMAMLGDQQVTAVGTSQAWGSVVTTGSCSLPSRQPDPGRGRTQENCLSSWDLLSPALGAGAGGVLRAGAEPRPCDSLQPGQEGWAGGSLGKMLPGPSQSSGLGRGDRTAAIGPWRPRAGGVPVRCWGAGTKCYTLGFKQERFPLSHSGGQKPGTKVPAWLFPLKRPSQPLPAPRGPAAAGPNPWSPLGVSLCEPRAPVPPVHENACHPGSGPHSSMTSSQLITSVITLVPNKVTF